jgi:integrase
MQYLTREELVRLFNVTRAHNTLHHLAMLVGLLHGLRVSEMLAIHGRDICDGKLSVRRLKKSRATLHALRIDNRDVLFDESPLLPLATANPSERSIGHVNIPIQSSNDIRPSLASTPRSRTTMF